MDTFKPSNLGWQAYIQKVLRAERRSTSALFGIGRVLQEGKGLGADIIRHCLLLIGVFGLVAIAVGALTDCQIYWRVLNWASSLFY